MTRHLFCTAAVLLASGQPRAAEAPPHCPPSLAITEALAIVPAGFQPFQDGNPPAPLTTTPIQHPLRTIMFSEGPPNDQTWLAPDRTARSALDWDFAAAKDQDVWLSCGYQATSVLISKKLPAATKQCTVLISPSDQTSTGLNCR